MKHTLVAVFSDEDELKIRAMLDAAGAEDALKIPFGRGCDRKKADAALRYHITVAHSSRETDAVFMERIGNFRFPGQCRVYVTGTGLMPGKEDTLVLCLEVSLSEEYRDMCAEVGKVLRKETAGHPHITLAVSKDQDRIRRIRESLDRDVRFPFQMTVTGLYLYRIWDPVSLVRIFD